MDFKQIVSSIKQAREINKRYKKARKGMRKISLSNFCQLVSHELPWRSVFSEFSEFIVAIFSFKTLDSIQEEWNDFILLFTGKLNLVGFRIPMLGLPSLTKWQNRAIILKFFCQMKGYPFSLRCLKTGSNFYKKDKFINLINNCFIGIEDKKPDFDYDSLHTEFLSFAGQYYKIMSCATTFAKQGSSIDEIVSMIKTEAS